MLASCVVIFFAFFRNDDDTRKKLIFCLFGGSSLVASLVQIILGAINWNVTCSSRLTLTVAYAVIAICLGELLSLAWIQAHKLVLPDFLRNSAVNQEVAALYTAAVNFLTGLLVGICFGQRSANVWKTGFAYTIVLWFANAGFYVLWGVWIEYVGKVGWGGEGMQNGFRPADYNAPGEIGGGSSYPPPE
jgi:hypothetical protein